MSRMTELIDKAMRSRKTEPAVLILLALTLGLYIATLLMVQP